MNLTYPAIFAVRGRSYHEAMSRFPSARDREFEGLFIRHPVGPGTKLFDIPAGGGYLGRVLPAGTLLTGLELTDGFGGELPVYNQDAPWGLGKFDRGICLAALHHIDDQAAFLGSLTRGLGPAGLLHIGDVEAGSSIAEFLDGFVGRYNTTGHDGTYLDPSSLPVPSGTDIVRVERREVPWHFDNEASLAAFCEGLFGLTDCPQRELVRALERDVGIESTGQGVSVRWRLLYVDLQQCE